MKNKSVMYQAVLAAFLATSSAAALAVDEAEFNSPINAAQQLVVGQDGSVTVGASLSSTGDVDYFSFQGKEGNVVTIDIDGGWKGTTGDSVNSMIALFGFTPTPEGNYDPNFHKYADNNDSPLDDGSMQFNTTTSTKDSRIDNYRLPRDGTYVVGVSTSGKQFNHGGSLTTFSQTAMAVGSYALIISGVTPPKPPLTHVNIDIKPGNKQDATRLNPKAKGVVPVAILSQEGFDPMSVDLASIGFGATGDEKSLQRCYKDRKDLNGDGKPDLVCHFDNELANFVIGDTMGVVKGKHGDKKQFEGRGSLKVIADERE